MFRLPDLLATSRPLLYKLRDPKHDPVATEQRGRAGVQRLRPLLQAARGQPASGDAERRHSDEEEEAEERVGRVGSAGKEIQKQRRRRRFETTNLMGHSRPLFLNFSSFQQLTVETFSE